MDRSCDAFLQLRNSRAAGTIALGHEDDFAHGHIQLIGCTGLVSIGCAELISGFKTSLLRSFDPLENTQHRVVRIPDFYIHQFDLLFDGFTEPRI